MLNLIILALAALFGAIYQDTILYWASRVLAKVRPDASLLGNWNVEYEVENEVVEEKLKIYAPIAHARYGDLQAKVRSGDTVKYLVRLEHQYNNIYSAVIRPQFHPRDDLALGLVRFDPETGDVTGKVLGLSQTRMNEGEEAYIRTFTAKRA